ncbi:MAG: EAL domain-containing protein [Burkholderiales bacterium]
MSWNSPTLLRKPAMNRDSKDRADQTAKPDSSTGTSASGSPRGPGETPGAVPLALRQMLDQFPVLIQAVSVDDAMTVVFWNRECERITGYGSTEMVGNPRALHLLYPDPAYRIRKMAEWAAEAPHFRDFELTLTTRQQKRRRIAWSAISCVESGAGTNQIWCVGVDVTALGESERQVRQRDQLLTSVFRHLPDIVTLKDGAGRHLMGSSAATAAMGLSTQELKGMTNLDLVERGHPLSETLRHSALSEEATWQSGRLSQMEEVTEGSSGRQRAFDVLRVPSFGRQGQRQNMLVIRREITDQRTAATKLELAGRVLDQSTDGILIADADNRITMVNAAFTEITGYEPADALGKKPSLLSSGLHDAAFYGSLWEELNRVGRWSGEIWNRRKNGEVYPQWMSLSVLNHRSSGRVTHYVASFSDLSSRKAAEEKIALLSTQDPITGLPNRFQLGLSGNLALSQAKATNEQLALMVIDIDNFKTLNESLSHAAGDQLLREVGKRLVTAAGDRAAVGRLSGDEFLVLLPGIQGTADAAHIARNLMDGVAQPMVLRDVPVSISVSIGIAVFPGDGDTFDALFGRADAALYAAKRSGRATYQFSSPNMNQAALDRLQIESSLRRAIDENALRLEYQPLIDIASGRTVGCEALCRWDDPQRGAIPPSVFIPVAEDSGMIEALGGWVLRTATQQLRAWHDAGHPDLIMAVNLSALQFRRGVVLQQVEEALRISGIPPNRLELELTESVLLTDSEAVIATLRQLKAMGVTLSIDDFGTGYSSFAYLRRFKFDKIKIDQSFIRDLIDDADIAAIVRGMISLGLSLGLDVLAEGVESHAVAQRLRHMQCTFAQGYHFARPLRPEVFSQRLQLNLAA